MKKTILMITAVMMSMTAMAQNDTLTIIRPDSVSIVRNNENVSINVFGNGESRDYRYSMNFGVNSDQPMVTKETKASMLDEFDLGIPLFGNNNEKDYGYVEGYLSPGILWGCTGITGGSGVDINPFASINIWLPGIATFDYHATKHFTLGLSWGMEWRNYRMIDDKRFTLSNDKVVGMGNYPDDCTPDFSRIKIISHTFSLTGRLHFAKDAYLRLGPVFSFNEGLSVKTKYKNASGKKVKEKVDGPKANLFRLEWLADVQYNCFGFFVRYSPNSVLRKGYGPEFSTTTVGVSIGW